MKPRLSSIWGKDGKHLKSDDDALNALMDSFEESRPLDWSASLKWLVDHPSAEPGGDPDLFDMPLPEGLPYPEGEEWAFAPHYGEQGEPIGTEWSIGKSGYIVVFAADESYILDSEGFRVS